MIHTWKTLIGQLLILAGIFEFGFAEEIETCITEELHISCPRDSVIYVKSADFGRMEVGRCITEEDEFLGCSNNVLELLDEWCSGRQECKFAVANDNLEAANENCLKILMKYLKVNYACTEVATRCRPNKPTHLSAKSGYISNLIASRIGCASAHSPWIVSASPGQTVELTMTDFSARSDGRSIISCGTVYGFVLERSLGINHTICGGQGRQLALYTSKTNSLEIHLATSDRRAPTNFLIRYTVTGCSEITPAAHTWYKREGNEAVIGCDNNNMEWRMTCVDNRWVGEAGNCSATVMVTKEEIAPPGVLNISSIVVISGIAGVAVLLSVIAVVCGLVYINKYRMKQEVKRANLYKTYSTIGSNVQAYYRPVTVDQSENNATSWDMSLLPANQMTLLSEKCTCPTLQMRNQGEGDKTGGDRSLERQSLYSSIRST